MSEWRGKPTNHVSSGSDALECECVDKQEYTKLLVVASFVWGCVIGIMISLVIELGISPYIASTAIMAIIVAPFVEEFFKSIFVYTETNKDRIYLIIILSAFGFGLGEWLLKSIIYGDFGLSFTVIGHVLFTLPLAMIYVIKPSRNNYIIGYGVAVVLHACWNYIAIN